MNTKPLGQIGTGSSSPPHRDQFGPVAVEPAFTVVFPPGHCPAATNARDLGLRIKCFLMCRHGSPPSFVAPGAAKRCWGAGSALCRRLLTQRGNPGISFHGGLEQVTNSLQCVSAATTGDFRVCCIAAVQGTVATLSGAAAHLPGLPGLHLGQDLDHTLRGMSANRIFIPGNSAKLVTLGVT